MTKSLQSVPKEKALKLFLKHRGYLRASVAFKNGVQRRDLYALRDEGSIEVVTRGLFRLASMPELESPSLFIVGVKVPQGVVCLESALAFHQLIKQVPDDFSVALVKGSDKPKIQNVSLKFYLISEPAFSEGIEIYRQDGIELRIYSPEKTLADCFKFRNKIGLKVCLDGLQEWWRWERKRPALLLKFAKGCKVEKTIRPYLELLSSQDAARKQIE